MAKHTNEELLSMGYQQRQVELELAALEEQLASKDQGEVAEILSLTKPFDIAVTTPPEPKPAPAEPEVKSEVKVEPTPEPEISEQEAQPEPEPPKAEPVKDVDFWRKEAETWKKRKGDADRALTPAQQEAARLRKEKEERDAIFLRRLDEIESLVKQGAKPVSQSEPDLGSLIDNEFRETYPDIAARLEAMQKANELRVAKAEARTKEFEAFFEKQRQEAEAARLEEYKVKHYSETKRLIPEIDEFVDPEKLGTPLVAWGQTQPPYKLDVILNPLSYSPSDVADVINQFKHSTGLNSPKPVKKPNLGDIATRATGAPTNIAEPKGESVLSDEEFSNIDELLRQNAKNPKRVQELVELFERTAVHKSR